LWPDKIVLRIAPRLSRQRNRHARWWSKRNASLRATHRSSAFPLSKISPVDLRNDLIWHKTKRNSQARGHRLKLSPRTFFHFCSTGKVGRAKYYYKVSHAEKRQNDVIVVNSEAGEADHTATFPSAVIAPRIVSSCPVGGLVLDPFCGTGRALR